MIRQIVWIGVGFSVIVINIALPAFLGMVPLRFFRVVLILLAVSLVLTVVDELMVWSRMPGDLRVLATGLASGSIIFALIYRGGAGIRFTMRTRPGFLFTVQVVLHRYVTRLRCGRGILRATRGSHRLFRRLLAFPLIPSSLNLSVSRALVIATRGLRRPAPDVVLYRSLRPSAVTANDGSGTCIFLSTALVRRLSADSLAAVLSHECGHIQKRHPLRQAIVLGLLAGIKMSIGIPPAVVVPILLAYLLMLREWEYVADRHAATVVGGNVMRAAFAEYQAISGDTDGPAWREIFSGHPSIGHRIAALRDLEELGEEIEIPQVLPYQPRKALVNQNAGTKYDVR